MKYIPQMVTLTFVAAVFGFYAPQARAADCSGAWYDAELALDTADAICGSQGYTDLCAYALDVAFEMLDTWYQCEYQVHGNPL